MDDGWELHWVRIWSRYVAETLLRCGCCMKIWVSAVKHNCLTNFRCLNCDFSTERASSCYCTSCNDEHVCSIWPCTNGDRSRVWKMSEMFSSLNSCHIDKVTSNDAVPFVREGRAPCQENRARGDTYCKEVLREATGSWKRACNHLAIIYLKSGTIATSQPVQLSLCHALTAQINGKGWVGGLEKDGPRLCMLTGGNSSLLAQNDWWF